MKLLILSKRYPQQRDLLRDPYGRFFHLPRLLADSGHDIAVCCLSHDRSHSRSYSAESLTYVSEDMFRHPLSYIRFLRGYCHQQRPDWIIGFSDTWYGVLAVHLAQRHGRRALIDAYDNYEAYMPWNRPLHWLWRRALKRADLLTAAGPHLAELMNRSRGKDDCVIVPMAADPEFRPGSRNEARIALGLPENATIVAYVGSLAEGRDVGTLFSVVEDMPDTLFIASGRTMLGCPDALRHLGYLDHAKVPLMYAAADAVVITAEDNRFGRYAHPAKLYEAMACGIPIVCANLPVIRWIAGDQATYYQPANTASLRAAIRKALKEKKRPSAVGSWEESARLFEKALLETI